MKQPLMSIGRTCRDSKQHRFSLPNKIWEYSLKPIEFMIFSYLCCYQSHHLSNVVTLEVVATGIHTTDNTAQKYLSALVNKGLITGEYSFAPDFQCGNGGKFFTLPNEIFLLQLAPSAFMVYAYLLLVENRKTHTCHPSYNTIAAESGMSKNTALKSIGILLEMGLISVEASSYFDQHGMKWKGNNLYTILPISLAMDIFHQRQLHRLDLAAEQIRIRKLQESDAHRRPRAAL